MLQIISGSNSLNIAEKLAESLECSLIKHCKQNFPDQELKIKLHPSINQNDAVIVQSTSKPANDTLIELLLLADAVKRTPAKQIIAVVPYFGYSRQDKILCDFEPLSAELIAKLIELSGINSLITVDLHSPKIQQFFKIKTINLSAVELFAEKIKNQKNIIVIAPDCGSKTRATQLSNLLHTDMAAIHKIRNANNHCSMTEISQNVQGKNCIIIDDIIDTGETLCLATDLLIQKGAASVTAVVTHAVLSEGAIDRIENSNISSIIVTNSIHHNSLPGKFEIIDITSILQKGIEIMLAA
jgi:ribose-phosphate pyrophosphokinase